MIIRCSAGIVYMIILRVSFEGMFTGYTLSSDLPTLYRVYIIILQATNIEGHVT